MQDIIVRVTPETIDVLALSQPDHVIEILNDMPAHDEFWQEFHDWLEEIK